MTLKRASFTSSLFIVSSFQLHIYHPPPFSVHLKERISREAERRGCPASIVSNDEFDSSSLPHEDAILFVVSTTGQGDSPDSFKFVTKKLDKRLLDLGATTIIEKGLGDDQHPSWYGTLKRLRNRASLKNSGQQAHLIWTTSPFLLKEEAYHPARLLNLNLLPETQIPCLSLPSSLESDNWNAASYDSLKNAEVMSPLIIVSHCPHDGGLLFFMGRSCINV
uniref:Flavodoxin-like domain-containing protein n=1 Tax=Brassica oleracea var. oleracea TaxID=109376 RepID=A0A0D3DJT4_BRAOL